ncbi:GntR family transcriptional regulator [Paracoccus sediminilitoris]|uniref:GntR family transcriptional regulator n=1 Tax=Paracoccus sediminilitoris TaxID=2202419 RepID=UPI00272D6C31|nr:GntR family transcriptional regulator [Paracoccus sediminilitoris]
MRRRTRADVVHDALRHLIVTLELAPGQLLSEKEMCDRFGVSRTPIREAFLRLAEHGLVTVAPQHGTFVAGISPKAVRLAHFLRENLEIPAIRRLAGQPAPDLSAARDILVAQKVAAARNDQAEFILLDDRYHEALFDAVDLSDVWAVIQARKGHLDRIRFIQGTVRGSVEVPLRQHEQILDALTAQDGDLAARLLKDHIAGSLAFLARHLRERPEMFIDDEQTGGTGAGT